MGRALRIGLALLVFALLARWVHLPSLLRLARGASPVRLLASVGAFAVDQLLSTQKWRLLLRGVGLEMDFYSLLKTTTKAYFVSFFVPSAITADLYKGVSLARRVGAGGSVTSSIVLERLLGVASIVTVSAMSVGLLPARLVDRGAPLAIAGLWVALCAGLALFLHADRVFAAVRHLLPRAVDRRASILVDLTAAFAAYRPQRRLQVVCFLLSVAIQASRATAIFAVAAALGDATPFWAFLLLVPYVYMVNLLPFATSRLGLEQGAFVVLFGAVGMPAEVALTVSLLSVVTSLAVALPGGVWLVSDRRSPPGGALAR